jgi:hypothetical protein
MFSGIEAVKSTETRDKMKLLKIQKLAAVILNCFLSSPKVRAAVSLTAIFISVCPVHTIYMITLT